MRTFWKILCGVWDILQISLAFGLFYAFSQPGPAYDRGHAVLWVLGHPTPVEGEAFSFAFLHLELLTIIGALAMVYVLIGFVQAAYVPKTEGWTRGANWVASAIVLIPIVWAWWQLIGNPVYRLTLPQQQWLVIASFAVAFDVCMDLLLPWIGKVAKKVVTVTGTT